MDSLHKEVKKQIKEQLEGLKEGDKLPSERSFSDDFKVSRVTIRHALNELKKEGFIIKRHGSGNYVNIKENNIPVKLIIPSRVINEHNQIVDGVTDAFKEKNTPIQVLDCFFDQKKENFYLDQILHSNDVEGAIIYPFFRDALNPVYMKKINDIINTGKKIIFIDQFVPGIEADFVVPNKFKTAYLMTENLIGLGNRDIILVSTGDYDTTGKVCKRGYKKALNDYDIPIREDLIVDIDMDFGKNAIYTYDKITEFINNKVFFSGIVSSYQTFTYGIQKALYDNGITNIDLISMNSEDNSFEMEIKKPYFKDDFYSLGKKAGELYFENRVISEQGVDKKIHFVDAKYIL